jgi:hypothetical protein
MTANLMLALLILIGFWTAVFWGAIKWGKKHGKPRGRTVWQVIFWTIIVSSIARLLQGLLGYTR